MPPKALNEHHISVPEKVPLIGFDGANLCNYVNPQLPTIDQFGLKRGQIAAEKLISFLENGRLITSHFLSPRLVQVALLLSFPFDTPYMQAHGRYAFVDKKAIETRAFYDALKRELRWELWNITHSLVIRGLIEMLMKASKAPKWCFGFYLPELLGAEERSYI